MHEKNVVVLRQQYDEPNHFFIHISDTHLLGGEENLYNSSANSDFYLLQVFKTIKDSGLKPDAFIFTGDLADKGESAAYEKLRKIVEPAATELGAQVIWAMGNHDDRANFRNVLHGAQSSYEPVDEVYFINGVRIIVLDSTVPGKHYGLVSDDQLKWLSTILKTATPEGSLLVMHHPPLPSVLRLAAAVELQDQDALEAVLLNSDIKSILAGHLHYSSSGLFAGIPVSVASATCYTQDLGVSVGGTRGQDAGQGFNLVHMYNKTVLHSVVNISAGATVGEFVSASETRSLLQSSGLL